MSSIGHTTAKWPVSMVICWVQTELTAALKLIGNSKVCKRHLAEALVGSWGSFQAITNWQLHEMVSIILLLAFFLRD